jgi:peptide-methionine (R)-S-oxide reductase
MEMMLKTSIKMKLNKLTDEEQAVVVGKQTEAPFSGEYDEFFKKGMFVCRQCNNPLYSSEAKFKSGCGWPSFDDEVQGSVLRVPDGIRTEIVCAKCDGHLGHVFTGEGYTEKDVRHCVNSLSIKFIPEK